MKKIIKKTALYLAILIAAYLCIGYLLHLVIFPEIKPAVSSYFKPGQQFYSKSEGFLQTVEKQDNGNVFCSLEIEPFAGGPPKHIHTGFDEFFEVSNGELTIWVNGEVKKIHSGEKLFIPKGTPHKPYNETADTIHANGSISFPEKFAYNLKQVYGVVDNTPGFEKSPKAILQMSLFAQAGFDSYAVDGPPLFVQKATSFLLAPLARMCGYKSYYKEYDVQIARK